MRTALSIPATSSFSRRYLTRWLTPPPSIAALNTLACGGDDHWPTAKRTSKVEKRTATGYILGMQRSGLKEVRQAQGIDHEDFE
ncbi:MAG: hypothetical protein EOO60_13720 [Hymenobacter sp.]|nr:MAG: hypothetical protein EOO60_13720 [Hymenobacter sp.]